MKRNQHPDGGAPTDILNSFPSMGGGDRRRWPRAPLGRGRRRRNEGRGLVSTAAAAAGAADPRAPFPLLHVTSQKLLAPSDLFPRCSGPLAALAQGTESAPRVPSPCPVPPQPTGAGPPLPAPAAAWGLRSALPSAGSPSLRATRSPGPLHTRSWGAPGPTAPGPGAGHCGLLDSFH